MQPLRLAVATRSLKAPLKTAMKAAADLGAEGVQLDLRDELRPDELTETGRRQFRHFAGELGLRISGAVLPLRRPLHEEEHLDTRIAAVRSAMQFAWELQAGALCIRIGRIPVDEASHARQILTEVVSDLARYGNHVGTTLAVTPTGDAPETLDAFVRQITSGPLGVDFDPAGCAMAAIDPVAALRTLHALVVHVQLRDGLREIDGSGLETAVGRGETPWDELLATLGEMNYPGWMTAIRTHGDDRPGDVGRALQYVRRIALGG